MATIKSRTVFAAVGTAGAVCLLAAKFVPFVSSPNPIIGSLTLGDGIENGPGSVSWGGDTRIFTAFALLLAASFATSRGSQTVSAFAIGAAFAWIGAIALGALDWYHEIHQMAGSFGVEQESIRMVWRSGSTYILGGVLSTIILSVYTVVSLIKRRNK